MPTPCEEDVDLLGAGGADSPLKRPATAVTPKKKTKTKEDAPEPSPKPKATPKAAKGKGTVAAKTKAAPKSKTKALKPILKKPSSNGAPFKKPAAGGSSGSKNKIFELCNKWEKGVPETDPNKEGEEEEPEVSDPETDPDATEKRNKYVGLKFQTMRKQGKIPQHILDVVDSAVTRSGKTSLMNKLFQKDKSGSWIMQTNHPSFKHTTTSHDKSFGKEQQNSYPRTIMIHLYFNGIEQAFLSALDEGDVFPVETQDGSGKMFYSFWSNKSGKVKELDKAMQLSTGEVELSANDHAQMQKGMKSLGGSSKDKPGLEDEPTPKEHQLALTAGKEETLPFDKVVGILQEAKEAAEKLLKDIAKVLPSLNSHPDLKLESKDAFQILTTNANTVSNILVWQELPDGPMTKKTWMSSW